MQKEIVNSSTVKNSTARELMRLFQIFLFTEALILTLFGVLGDHLLFNSDPFSLVHFITGASLFTFLITLPLTSTFLWLKKSFETERLIALIVFFNIIFFALDSLLQKHLAKNPNQILAWTPVLVCVIAAVVIAVRLKIDSQQKALLGRLSAGVFVVSLGAFVFLYLNSPLQPTAKTATAQPAKNAKAQPENLLLFIFDGLDTHSMSAYNPKADTPGLESFSSQSTVFNQAHTNYTYTSGFFKTLYSGKKNYFRKNISENLLQDVQKNGYLAFFNTFHSNGVPDSSDIRNYVGLRSYFLTQFYTWIPQALKVPYHVLRYNGATSFERVPVRCRGLYSLLNAPQPESSVLDTHIAQEINFFTQTRKPFLYVIHVTRVASIRSEKRELWASRDDLDQNSPEAHDHEVKMMAEFKKTDNTYDVNNSEHTEQVKKWRAKDDGYIKIGFDSFGRLFKHIEAIKDAQFKIILTADHGYILDRGQVWYGYHYAEEVARVPLIIYPAKNSKTDNELAETIDLTSTISSHFSSHFSSHPSSHASSQKQSPLVHPARVSLFSDQPRRLLFVTTMTVGGRKTGKDTKYLNVYTPDLTRKTFELVEDTATMVSATSLTALNESAPFIPIDAKTQNFINVLLKDYGLKKTASKN